MNAAYDDWESELDSIVDRVGMHAILDALAEACIARQQQVLHDRAAFNHWGVLHEVLFNVAETVYNMDDPTF
jgi:hypothetical protein